MFTKWWTANSSGPKLRGRKYIIATLCLTLVLVSGCSLLPKEDEEEVLPTINPPQLSKKPEYTVKTGTIESKVRGIGQIMATKEEELFFTEDGKRVKEVYVNTGDHVEAGQPIADLDVEDLESQLRQSRLQSRKDELNMIMTLRNTEGKSAEELEQAKIDFQLKQENVRKLEQEVAKAKLTAPFSGTIVGMYMKKGDATKAYDTVAVIADMAKLTVGVKISADDLKQVAVGMEAEVDINAAGTHQGKVVQLPNPKSDSQQQNGGTVYGGYPQQQQPQKDSIDNYVLIELDQMPPKLSRGTPLSASIIVEKKENAITIPLAALRSITGRYYVQVVDDKGNKREVDVEVGKRTSTDVEIVKGLTPGQKVVGQ